jgi:hypothetical protein
MAQYPVERAKHCSHCNLHAVRHRTAPRYPYSRARECRGAHQLYHSLGREGDGVRRTEPSQTHSATRVTAHKPCQATSKMTRHPRSMQQLHPNTPVAPFDSRMLTFSIRRSDSRSSLILLERGGNLIKKLKLLKSSDTPPAPPDSYRETSASSAHALFNTLRPPTYRSSSCTSTYDGDVVQPCTGRPRRRRGINCHSRSIKHCQASGCGNVPVSRDVCRSHGGGRRCQHVGCSRSAQSRSVFCWAHSGGQRCEVAGCRRSRKPKRFCVDHMCLENGGAASGMPRLPSLQEALRNIQQTPTPMMFCGC